MVQGLCDGLAAQVHKGLGLGENNFFAADYTLAENGFENIKFTRDLGGIVRTVTAQKTEENNG